MEEWRYSYKFLTSELGAGHLTPGKQLPVHVE
jgi:hypothetical protein